MALERFIDWKPSVKTLEVESRRQLTAISENFVDLLAVLRERGDLTDEEDDGDADED